jgi:hypothetical protein
LELENKFNVHNISQNSIIAPIFYLLWTFVFNLV